jgi:hypothetical protein
MPAESDKYIVATFALWAGDFAFAETLLREFSPPRNTPSLEGGIEAPEDIMRATGVLRLRQLWQRRGEFQKYVAEYRSHGMELVEQPLVVRTEHLRGVVWRTGEREFQMQAYLVDLSWQDELFNRAHAEAGRHETARPSGRGTAAEPLELGREDIVGRGLGRAWTVTGHPFLQVEVTDLGLIDASMVWVEARLPERGEEIIGPFRGILNSLDEPAAER